MAMIPGRSQDMSSLLQSFVLSNGNKDSPVLPLSDTGDTETVEPIRRTLLNLDSRFFPLGIKPGDLIELKGSEGSGKTFTITYLLARLLFVHPTQMVILIDTQHHFSLQNLISILSYFDSEIVPLGQRPDGDMLTPQIPCPKLISYLRRLLTIPCFTSAELLGLFQLQPSAQQCQSLENFLLVNPAVSLVLIDAIDTFAYIPDENQTLQEINPENQILQPNSRNLLQLVRDAVGPTGTPVICTRISSEGGYAQRRSHRRLAQAIDPSSSPHRQILLNEDYFTQTLSLVPQAPQPLTLGQLNFPPFAEQSKLEEEIGVWNENVKTDCVAYLRSKSRHGNPNPGSGIVGNLNQLNRVKFSIFSGMLWVFEEQGKDERLIGGTGK